MHFAGRIETSEAVEYFCYKCFLLIGGFDTGSLSLAPLNHQSLGVM